MASKHLSEGKTAIVLIAAVGAGGAVWAGLAQSDDTQQARGDSTGGASDPTQQLEVPPTVAREVRSIGPENVELSQTIKALTVGGWSVYSTPADGGACVSLEDPDEGVSTTCATEKQLSEGPGKPSAALMECDDGLDPTRMPVCDKALLWGVVPKDVHTVSVETEQGQRILASGTESSAYLVLVSLSDRPSRLLFEGDGGVSAQPAGEFAGFLPRQH